MLLGVKCEVSQQILRPLRQSLQGKTTQAPIMQLDQEQTQAVESRSNLILVCASPGSGKTATLVNRLVRLMRQGADWRKMVIITFTNAAANEIVKRVRGEFLNPGPRFGYIGTLHGYMLKLLQEHGNLVGLPQTIGVMDEEQTGELVEQCIAEMSWKGSKTAVLVRIADGPFNFKGAPGPVDLVAVHFWRFMQRTGLLSFDALLHYGLRLITFWRVPEIEHLLVDEVQDLNDVEFGVIDALPARNRFLVGDVDQAIFGWKGGNCQHMIDLARRGR